MTPQHRRNSSLVFAAATIFFAMPALAQIAAGQGHANDANNQVGSGGRNANVARPGLAPNQVIDSSATALFPFSGPLGERDPSTFDRPFSTIADGFVGRSNGVPNPYQPQTSASAPRLLDGDNRVAAASVGAMQIQTGIVSMQGSVPLFPGSPLYGPASTNNVPVKTVDPSADSKGAQNGTIANQGAQSGGEAPQPIKPLNGVAQGQSNLPPANSADNPSSSIGSTKSGSAQVESLAEGVTAKGLHELLTSAEQLMRQDKFESAIKQYETAQALSPENRLIALGRANAELGAGYYQLASVDLHQLFEKNPALLLGQYDLANWLNPRRLKFINKELTDLALSDQEQEMPMFLLAYIAYNTGDAAKAARYLESAQERAGGRDPVPEKLQTNWHLAADLNK